MKTHNHVLRKTALATAVVLLVGGVSTMDSSIIGGAGYSWMASAYAAEDGSSGKGPSGGHKGAMGEGRGGEAAKGAGGAGYRGGKSVKDVLAEDDDGDSDRPDWAGVAGGEGRPGGGGNPSPGDTKGDVYGDMIMLLRDPVTGLPVTSDDGWTYACTDLACTEAAAVEMVGGEVPEGVTTYEVDFGRASVARSPSSVIDHALEEALSKLTADGATLSQDEAGRIVIFVNGVETSTIDSPLENLALYIDLMQGLASIDSTSATEAALGDLATLDTAASLLAGVADKTGDIGLDFVMYENLIAGVEADFTGFDYTRSFPVDYTYLWAPDTVTEPVYKTLNINVYLDAINDPLPADYEFAALFAAAADDAVEVIELVHTQIVISEEPLPGTQ